MSFFVCAATGAPLAGAPDVVGVVVPPHAATRSPTAASTAAVARMRSIAPLLWHR
jgi:hypothetical protein